MKKALLWVLMVLLGVCAAAEEGIRGYEKGKGYQYVSFGQYLYEKDGTVKPVIWRVLDVWDTLKGD